MTSGVSPLADPLATAAALVRGEVVLMPTDTVPGLHARADRPEAIARIHALKGRPVQQPLLVLAGSRDQVAQFVIAPPPRVASILDRCWPGPFTFVLRASAQVTSAITGGRETIAVRVPDLDWLRDLVLLAGAPLVSTSANRSGEPAATDLATARTAFADVPWYAGPPAGAPAGQASALVDLTVWPPRVLRPGPRPFPDEGWPS